MQTGNHVGANEPSEVALHWSTLWLSGKTKTQCDMGPHFAFSNLYYSSIILLFASSSMAAIARTHNAFRSGGSLRKLGG